MSAVDSLGPTRIKFCGMTTLRRRRSWRSTRARGRSADPVAAGRRALRRRPRRPRIAAAVRAAAGARRRVRQPDARRGRAGGRRDRADDGPAARRRGPGLLRGGRRGARARRSSRPCRCGGQADMQAIEALPHRLPPARRPSPGQRGGTGETFDWELRRASALEGPAGAQRRPDRRQRRRGDRRRRARSRSTSRRAPRRRRGVKDPAKLIAFVAAVARATRQEVAA